MRQDTSRLFWVSYSDLMTALFIIALALFVLSYRMFKVKASDLLKMEEELKLRSLELDAQSIAMEDLERKLSEKEMYASTLIEQLNNERMRLLVMEEEYKKLQEIQKAIENLDQRYFMYQPEYKRHVLRRQVQFAKGKSDIQQQYKAMLLQSGRALKQMVDNLEPDDNIKYLLVIEGMASSDNYTRNYELSYERALSLYQLWQESGMTFDQNRVEVVIAGSGEGGVGRDEVNEELNQRFLLQIIPKIGELRGIEYPADSLNTDEFEQELETE